MTAELERLAVLVDGLPPRFRGTGRHLGLDFHSDPYLRLRQRGQMIQHFLGYLPEVARRPAAFSSTDP